MKKIHFLGRVITEQVLVINETNIHDLPVGNVSEKRVEFANSKPKSGDLIYVYNAEIDEEKKVIIREYTSISFSAPESSSKKVPRIATESEDEILDTINSHTCYPWEVPPRR